ncbi:type II toxin-antitoxin system RelE/ParE family toxin [Sphingobium sp.]|uniref:type II toxin-antitoxin system RelE/ParE family toxin n=1 Tax=Sphingobium sp. TaxID=1912891 RepID=UPI0026094BDC|nr:type II toxin-antitoxin system RelE/ParE family toxin [Sphingobium sp.]
MTAEKRYLVDMTQGAADDLDAIHAYITDQRTLDDADALLNALYERVETLEYFALRGSLVPEATEVGNREMRQILHLPYRLIYHVAEDRVAIIAIIDGRRDVQTLLKGRLLAP